jgi:pullulanase
MLMGRFPLNRMPTRANKIAQAWLESPTTGVLELVRDWRARHAPPVALSHGMRFRSLERVPDHTFGVRSGYFVNRRSEIYFFLPPEAQPKPYARRDDAVYLAGDFNGWGAAIGREEWALRPASLDGEAALVWTGQAERFYANPPMRFKFVTGDGHWFDVPADAPNAQRDDAGNLNRTIDPERTGQHLFEFAVAAPLDLAIPWQITWSDGEQAQSVPLRPGNFFYQLRSDLPMGVQLENQYTTFRLFAPRARRVELCVKADLHDPEPFRYELDRADGEDGAAGVWQATLDQDLHHWFYWYHIDGPRDVFGMFEPTQPVLDPYALATVDREGPGIVLDRRRLRRPRDSFRTPAWQDLVICEAHVRDLAAEAPIPLAAHERRGFSGLRHWVESPQFYLHHLGVNCVELQPVQEFDNATADEYHWGYMTTAFLAPESSYALDPAGASGVRELQELVLAFHRRGIAVILDVVFNHVGMPAHLMFIDKLYYFEVERGGELSNWSGCGNDLRASSAMTRRLIVDACMHLIETYGVDGFRFDLAELIGVDVLRQVEFELKRVKPDVILIAEPWSFRGHIAGALGETGWASWNDGYRNFVRDYVRGGGSREAFEYFLKGSPWYFAHWPAQTVNYVESHDDRAWIDVITERNDGNGFRPTSNDRRRTHLMAAVLFCSIGIPMLSAGQDFLRSKQGINNTYQRGDLNALDYRRIRRYPATHAYFAEWIAFRRSSRGALLRHFSRATEGFFRFTFAPDSIAAAVVYNADRSQGAARLLFAINPTLADVQISLDAEIAEADWQPVADHEHFWSETRGRAVAGPLESELFLPALGCGLWWCEG